VKRHDGVDEQAQGPIPTSVVQMGDGTVSERTGGRDFNDAAEQPPEDKDCSTRCLHMKSFPTWETFYMQALYQHKLLINEQQISDINPLYELADTSRIQLQNAP
jgi:hypothetical protein